MFDLSRLSEQQREKLEAWRSQLKRAPTGATGGRFSFILTPTGLGTIIEVRDNVSGSSVDLTDYTTW